MRARPKPRRGLRADAVIVDEDYAVLIPQYEAVLTVLKRHPLGGSLEDTAALCALKVIAITWGQVREVAPELGTAAHRGRGGALDGPDDGGFYA